MEDRVVVYHGDCLEIMPQLPDQSIDLVVADLPYGVTKLKWDSVIPLDALWKEYRRLVKPNCGVLLFGREPFTSILVTSNIKAYHHKLVWNKKQSGSFQNAKYMPLQIDEDILVFCEKRPLRYFPIMREGVFRKKGGSKRNNICGASLEKGTVTYNNLYYPVNIIEYANPRLNRWHPTEKPVELLKYLIQMYSQEGDVVLDNTAGSGSTGVAALQTGRKCILIEKEQHFVDIIRQRISEYL